MCVLAIVDF
jgi:hypothetical protein